MVELEICVDSVESAIAAELGGAQRVELCSALAEGGLTPSLGLIRAVRARIGIGVSVMIRPRGGDFLYSDDELSIMRDDIALAADAGANGVVVGVLTADGRVDVDRTRQIVEKARSISRSMEVTFHRAIDMTHDMVCDPRRALEDVVRTGAHRVLTSGGAQTASLGGARLAELVHAAKGRIRVMVCGNVRPENVRQIAKATGAREFHAALRTPAPSPVTYRNTQLHLGEAGSDEYTRSVVAADDVRNLRQAMGGILSYSAKTVE